MSEYYTPTINEFYVGFEYEIKTNGEWKTEQYTLDKFPENTSWCLLAVLQSDMIRVKHLDREDIESFDFEFIETNKMSYWYEIEFCGHRLPESSYSFWKIFLRHDPKRGIVKIEATCSNGDRDVFFEGTIKNKSKLKEILTDIGILGE